jgi:hypothetical protein
MDMEPSTPLVVKEEQQASGGEKAETPDKPETDTKVELVTPGTEAKQQTEEEMKQPVKRRLTTKRLFNRRSVPAQKAAEQQKKTPQAEEAAPKPTSTPTAAPSIDTSSISFSPEEIAAESQNSVAAAATLESYVVTAENDERYIDKFWLVAVPLSRETSATSLSSHAKRRMAMLIWNRFTKKWERS